MTRLTTQWVKACLVAEGVYLPASPSAQSVLAERGVVVPDMVANAGGVVAAAFAMDARHSGFRPDAGNLFDAVSTPTVRQRHHSPVGGTPPQHPPTARAAAWRRADAGGDGEQARIRRH
ncbi:hypothetical protein ACTPOK_37845 [Streptomyces inhibens]